MRSNVTRLGFSLLSLTSLVGAAITGGCGKTTDSEVGAVYPIAGEQCSPAGETAAAADGCNECTCGGDGKWSCTDMACPGETPDSGAPCTGNRDCPGGPANSCVPGDTRMLECNKCFCNEERNWECTLMDCNPLPEAGACIPGDTKQVDCNACTCGGDGLWSCTNIACDPSGPTACEAGFLSSLSQVSDNQAFKIAITRPMPGTPILGSNTWYIEITDAAGAAVPDATLTVRCSMPLHTHGCPVTPEIASEGGGNYRIGTLIFNMSKVWNVTITVESAGVKDQATFDVCL